MVRSVIGCKKDVSPRITVDFQHLNKQCFQETHHTEPPFHLDRVPPNTKKTVLDATEPLPVAWGLQHSRMFPLGCTDLLISTDHKPLLGTFKDRDLDGIKNPCIQDFKEAILAWRFNITHIQASGIRAQMLSHVNPLLF